MTLTTKDDQTGDTGANGSGGGTLVRPGDTITVSISYNVNNTYCNCNAGAPRLWADIGGDGASIAPNLFQPGSIQNISGGSTSFSASTTNNATVAYPRSGTVAGQPVAGCDPGACGANASDYNPDACPSFYLDYDTAFSGIIKDGSGNHYGGAASGENQQLSSWGYPTDGSAGAPSGWRSTCGPLGGKSAVWTGVSKSAGVHTYTMRFGVSPGATSTSRFCIRGELAFQNFSALYARTTSLGCFQMQQVTVQGHVQSDPTAATGRPLNGVPVAVNGNCNSSAMSGTAYTNAAGDYSFQAILGAPFCISPPNPYAYPPSNTTYNNPTPAPGFPPNVCYSSPCGTYTFYYQPIPIPLVATKISNPASGTALVPGQSMLFSMTAPNPIDSNTGGGVNGASLNDEVPLNIDPNTVGGVSAQLTTVGPAPGGWSANVALPCTGIDSTFFYGYGGRSVAGAARCGYSPPNGSTPGYVYVVMSNMPAYSQVTLNWGGSAKTAQYVGVFPSNYAYCNNGSVNFSDPSSVLSKCADFSAGLQGVSNFAYTLTGSNMTPTYSSNTTYNPIPGGLNAVGKDTSAQLLDPAAGLTSLGPVDCDAQTPNTAGDPNNRWVYSPTTAGYSSAGFTVHVCPDFTHGPVYYYITDQDNGAHGPSSADLTSGGALDPALWNVTGEDAPGTYAGHVLRWNGIRSTDSVATHQNYNFNVAPFTDQGNGHVARNGAKACWPQYWNAPSSPGNYAVSCVASNNMAVTQETITYPFVSSANGDIHAGGGPSDLAGSNTCTTPSGPIETGQNPGAQGQYFVTASGNLDITSKQQFFNSTANTKSTSYGTVCRPDLVTSAKNYITQNPTKHVSLSIYGNTIPADQYAAGWDGKIVEASGDVTIPTNLVINARFTLLIHNGNLNVGGNVTTQSTTTAGPYGTPVDVSPASFGVIMDSGNIYIDKNVSQLAGFYYAAPTPNTAANGVINTCAGPDGRPALQAVPGPSYSVANCSTNQLVVQGLMMAYGFRLDRTRLGSTGSNSADAAEYVNFDDRLYTATPPGFSDLGQTYLPPIYLPQSNPRY